MFVQMFSPYILSAYSIQRQQYSNCCDGNDMRSFRLCAHRLTLVFMLINALEMQGVIFSCFLCKYFIQTDL